MAVVADQPRWANHGTLWGHLISDTSLDELHHAAERIGLPTRAFDLDHYDFPIELLPTLAEHGIQLVSAGELTRRLIRSGLRIPLKHRPAAIRERTLHDARAGTSHALPHIPQDFILGVRGHVLPLPNQPGAFRLTREAHDPQPVITAHDAAGRAAGEAFGELVEQWATGILGLEKFVGQAVDWPDPDPGLPTSVQLS